MYFWDLYFSNKKVGKILKLLICTKHANYNLWNFKQAYKSLLYSFIHMIQIMFKKFYLGKNLIIRLISCSKYRSGLCDKLAQLFLCFILFTYRINTQNKLSIISYMILLWADWMGNRYMNKNFIKWI